MFSLSRPVTPAATAPWSIAAVDDRFDPRFADLQKLVIGLQRVEHFSELGVFNFDMRSLAISIERETAGVAVSPEGIAGGVLQYGRGRSQQAVLSVVQQGIKHLRIPSVSAD